MGRSMIDPIHSLAFSVQANPGVYSDLLEEVARTSAERQQMLRGYIEPAEREREEGEKCPAAAHRAVAALVAQGFVDGSNRLLDRIFDEFGLIVCGWSAEWDNALYAAIMRAPSRRFTTYWAAKGEITERARKLIDARAAREISIENADNFFSAVHEQVEAINEFSRPHPLSTQAAVTTLKRYLSEPRYRIQLSDFVAKRTWKNVPIVCED